MYFDVGWFLQLYFPGSETLKKFKENHADPLFERWKYAKNEKLFHPDNDGDWTAGVKQMTDYNFFEIFYTWIYSEKITFHPVHQYRC